MTFKEFYMKKYKMDTWGVPGEPYDTVYDRTVLAMEEFLEYKMKQMFQNPGKFFNNDVPSS